jgi:hypothetical protein
MITLSLAVGTPEGDQLVAVFQAVLVAPVQVFWATVFIETIRSDTLKRMVKLFIIMTLFN